MCGIGNGVEEGQSRAIEVDKSLTFPAIESLDKMSEGKRKRLKSVREFVKKESQYQWVNFATLTE